MARGHPVDDVGRVLPDPAWPADKAAPDPWDVIRRFCNTCNRESGADRFDTDAGLQRWYDSEGIVGIASGPPDRTRLVRFREHVRAHALAHHDRDPERAPDGTHDSALDAALAAHVTGLQLTMVVRDGRLHAVPAARGAADRTIGIVALAILNAQREDCWRRFKACSNCEWVFYDRSRNQSGRWCSMSACGGRAKVAAFRAREKESTQ